MIIIIILSILIKYSLNNNSNISIVIEDRCREIIWYNSKISKKLFNSTINIKQRSFSHPTQIDHAIELK